MKPFVETATHTESSGNGDVAGEGEGETEEPCRRQKERIALAHICVHWGQLLVKGGQRGRELTLSLSCNGQREGADSTITLGLEPRGRGFLARDVVE